MVKTASYFYSFSLSLATFCSSAQAQEGYAQFLMQTCLEARTRGIFVLESTYPGNAAVTPNASAPLFQNDPFHRHPLSEQDRQAVITMLRLTEIVEVEVTRAADSRTGVGLLDRYLVDEESERLVAALKGLVDAKPWAILERLFYSCRLTRQEAHSFDFDFAVNANDLDGKTLGAIGLGHTLRLAMYREERDIFVDDRYPLEILIPSRPSDGGSNLPFEWRYVVTGRDASGTFGTADLAAGDDPTSGSVNIWPWYNEVKVRRILEEAELGTRVIYNETIYIK